MEDGVTMGEMSALRNTGTFTASCMSISAHGSYFSMSTIIFMLP